MGRNLKLTVEYDGTDFAGWQTQPEERTVQGEIEKVLSTILGEKIEVVGSGRTDSGVHAFGQVANFKLEKEVDLPKLAHSLNSMLPQDIVIRGFRGRGGLPRALQCHKQGIHLPDTHRTERPQSPLCLGATVRIGAG